MPGITLESFKAKVADGARPNRFLLTFASPGGGAGAESISFMVKGAQLPGRNIGEVIANWQGQQAKFAGDPTFDDFTVTFINDYGFVARTDIEKWMNGIANPNTNERGAHVEYKIDAIIQQLGRKGEVLAEYKMIGFYPKTMDVIDLNMESSDTFEEFTVS